jgi:hypothetical protein
VKMVSLILNCLKNKEKFVKTMEDLARRHCERGIRGIEYGIVGDVLLYTIKTTVGHVNFTREVETAWKLIYSSMIQVIVPLCVEYERTGVIKRTVERNTDSSGNGLSSNSKGGGSSMEGSNLSGTPGSMNESPQPDRT